MPVSQRSHQPGLPSTTWKADQNQGKHWLTVVFSVLDIEYVATPSPLNEMMNTFNSSYFRLLILFNN